MIVLLYFADVLKWNIWNIEIKYCLKMNFETNAIMCGISVHAIVEAKGPASFLNKLTLGTVLKQQTCKSYTSV